VCHQASTLRLEGKGIRGVVGKSRVRVHDNAGAALKRKKFRGTQKTKRQVRPRGTGQSPAYVGARHKTIKTQYKRQVGKRSGMKKGSRSLQFIIAKKQVFS